jgi:hypothetical protein
VKRRRRRDHRGKRGLRTLWTLLYGRRNFVERGVLVVVVLVRFAQIVKLLEMRT